MRTVDQVFLRVTKRNETISLDELTGVIRRDGWIVHARNAGPDEEWMSFRSDATPLMLVMCISSEFPDVLQVGLVEKWWRCALAGGWVKRGHMPNDLVQHIRERLSDSRWSVEQVLP